MMYVFSYLQLYSEDRLRHRIRPLLRLTLHAGLVTWAVYCSLSRVTDHAHHPSDVIAGVVIGGVIAVVAVSFTVTFTFYKDGFFPKT